MNDDGAELRIGLAQGAFNLLSVNVYLAEWSVGGISGMEDEV